MNELKTYYSSTCSNQSELYLQEGGLGGLNYPLLSDFHKNVSRDYGVLIEDAGIALRGLFIIDPQVKIFEGNLIKILFDKQHSSLLFL